MNKEKLTIDDLKPEDYPNMVEALEGEENFKEFVSHYFLYQDQHDWFTDDEILRYMKGTEEAAKTFSPSFWIIPWLNW